VLLGFVKFITFAVFAQYLRAVHANLYAGNGFGFSTGRAFNGIQLFSPVKRLEVELLDMTTPHGMRRIKVTDFKGSTGRLPRVQIIKNRPSHFQHLLGFQDQARF